MFFKNVVTVDFETFPIELRPAYPPEPVGVSIKMHNRRPIYYAWGHPSGNTHTKKQAMDALGKIWNDPKLQLLFHNAKFDLAVATEKLGLPMPHWTRVHDTAFLVFLHNPHEQDAGLKSAAQRELGLPPDERDEVIEWLVANQPVPGVKLTKARNGKNPYAGAYVAYAPGGLVGKYANGDVDRTDGLFRKLWKTVIKERGMHGAYDRERRLISALMRSERHGVRVDLKRLRHDVNMYSDWLEKIDSWILKRVGYGSTIKSEIPPNLNSAAELIELLQAANVVELSKLGYTDKGALRTDTDALDRAVSDQVLSKVLQYRAQLRTCLNTFLSKWLKMAEASNGLIFTNWNQIKGEFGTRTGRLSSTPNFQNIPKQFDPLFKDTRSASLKKLTAHLPKCPWPDLPPLPLCRSYVVPYTEDHVLLDRDYSQQEPRILAHFEGGELMEQYRASPWIDYHDNAKEHLEKILNRKFERKPVKNINLGIIYGQGVASLAEKNNSTIDETRRLRDAIFKLYPGLGKMYQEMKVLARDNQPLVTWGGREYYCQPPAIVNGRLRQFDYKMVNLLVQGSAADCTKEALVRFEQRVFELGKQNTWFVYMQVHDEILISAPRHEAKWAMRELKECMESIEFDVPMLSEGSWSDRNWAVLEDVDKRGVVLKEI
jgi:DNA polymerase-1